jgi:peptidoglycan/LPS O-acetylase OafA/YrhL
MFYGGYLRVLHDRGKSTAEKWKYLAALGPVIIALPLFPGLFHWATTGLYPGTTSSFATLLGVLLFYFFVFCRPLRSRFLVWLGTISYSVYLFHVVVFCAFYPALQRFPSLPLALPLVLAFALTLGLSHMVYFGIEKPCIEWGRTVSARFRRSLPSAV